LCGVSYHIIWDLKISKDIGLKEVISRSPNITRLQSLGRNIGSSKQRSDSISPRYIRAVLRSIWYNYLHTHTRAIAGRDRFGVNLNVMHNVPFARCAFRVSDAMAAISSFVVSSRISVSVRRTTSIYRWVLFGCS